jgi:predicted TPR repeat methyltransferase
MSQLTDNPELLEATKQQISVENALQLAIRLHQANEYELAEDVYRKLLELDPENPNILHFFGLLRHQRGYSEEGVEWIKKALKWVPDYVDAENNLGNIYQQTGHPELAEQSYRRVLDIAPKFVVAYGNLGVALNELGRHHEAIVYLLKGIDFQPDDAYLYQNLGNVYRNLKNYREAVGMYNKSLELKPFDADAYRRLSRTFYIMGEIENCIDVLKQWLDYDPKNAMALHMYAAYANTNAPSRASDAYVRETFDSFAASFDGVLKRLDYQAPFLVQKALQAVTPDINSWQLLDIGCGTGLCGALVRPMVKRLVGVDLSSKMLERARAREVYDELIEAELTAFCLQEKSVYHAITCVDTFCYFGDLTGAMQAALCALRPKGWFIFTLEKQEESDLPEGFHLNLHGRYSHTEAYLRNVLINAGFSIHSIETAVLRKERHDQVAGLVVTAISP